MILEFDFMGRQLTFETREGLFSPSHIDAGTQEMLRLADFKAGERVLDLGCGYGVVGVCAAVVTGAQAVTMTDVDERAVEAAACNMERNFGTENGSSAIVSDGLENVMTSDFDVILSNPPYHTDFSVAKGFIEKGYCHLKMGGRMLMVTKRRDWYENRLRAVFGGVRVFSADGYFVFLAVKKEKKRVENRPKRTMSKKLMRKYGL